MRSRRHRHRLLQALSRAARGAASRAGLEIDYIEMDYRSYRAAGVADW
ncbi:MAG: hypothetical protein VCF24_01015 [Candidatus Latescibacterota bacterium]